MIWNVNVDLYISFANDITIDIANRALPGKEMHWSPLPHLTLLANDKRRYLWNLIIPE